VKHIRAILAFSLILCTIFGYPQGKYTYQPVGFAPSLKTDTAIVNHLSVLDGYNKMTDFEKELVYSLNYLRKHPKMFLKEAVNPYLEAYPKLKPNYGESLQAQLSTTISVSELSIDSRLIEISRSHAADLGKNDLMSHRSSNGLSTQERYTKAGITCGSECINMGNFSSALEVLLSLLIDFNVPDLGHRKSLLNPKMTNVGVGAARGTDGQIQYTVIDLSCM